MFCCYVDSILLYDANTTLEIFSPTEKQKHLPQIQSSEYLTASHTWRQANPAPETDTELENIILGICKNSGTFVLR